MSIHELNYEDNVGDYTLHESLETNGTSKMIEDELEKADSVSRAENMKYAEIMQEFQDLSVEIDTKWQHQWVNCFNTFVQTRMNSHLFDASACQIR